MARNPDGTRPSRSQKRRVGDHSQRIARELMGLNDTVCARLPLVEHVRAAVDEARRVTSHIARRREERRLAAVLRDEDLEALDEIMSTERDANAGETQRFKRSERWRADLLEDDDAIDRFVAEVGVAREELRAHVDDARHERDTGRPRGGQRALFRFVRDAIEG